MKYIFKSPNIPDTGRVASSAPTTTIARGVVKSPKITKTSMNGDGITNPVKKKTRPTSDDSIPEFKKSFGFMVFPKSGLSIRIPAENTSRPNGSMTSEV